MAAKNARSGSAIHCPQTHMFLLHRSSKMNEEEKVACCYATQHNTFPPSSPSPPQKKFFNQPSGREKKFLVGSYPTSKRRYAKWKLSRNIYALHTRFFARLAPIRNARSVTSDKISAYRSSVGSLLRVRCWLGSRLSVCERQTRQDFLGGQSTSPSCTPNYTLPGVFHHFQQLLQPESTV